LKIKLAYNVKKEIVILFTSILYVLFAHYGLGVIRVVVAAISVAFNIIIIISVRGTAALPSTSGTSQMASAIFNQNRNQYQIAQ
jgi:short subunit fatty acids transporter